MVIAVIYIIGTLCLHLTDFSSPDFLYATLFPLIDALFLIFLIWQVLFYTTLSGIGGSNSYGFFDLLGDVYDLRYDVIEKGWLAALWELTLNLTECICFFLAVFYYFSMAIDLIS